MNEAPLPPAPTAGDVNQRLLDELIDLRQRGLLARNPTTLPKEAQPFLRANSSMGIGDGWELDVVGNAAQRTVLLRIRRHERTAWQMVLEVALRFSMDDPS